MSEIRHTLTDPSRLPLYTTNRRSPSELHDDVSSSSTATHLTGPVWPASTASRECSPPPRRHAQSVRSAEPLTTTFPATARHITAVPCALSAPPYLASPSIQCQ
ncbi:Os03g0625201 [Oryza sativa Japonica Group]|uniref:Os03g0625201 protein n=1 Tax=Oryza sativa subsp. japonica TaxID=39947 RepID=A0A0N7KHN8_ORYSJ|nr:hypothetical protein EE612_019015 [Oryza sativa]BAS85337.1 Os03g0625201 [Oryza sativa Japonica Group]